MDPKAGFLHRIPAGLHQPPGAALPPALPALRAEQEGAEAVERPGTRLAGLVAGGSGAHRHGSGGSVLQPERPCFPSSPSARIFAFPGLTDKAASPLIKRPGEWDQREAGVLRS